MNEVKLKKIRQTPCGLECNYEQKKQIIANSIVRIMANNRVMFNAMAKNSDFLSECINANRERISELERHLKWHRAAIAALFGVATGLWTAIAVLI